MRDANNAETTQGKPDGRPGVVFRNERLWRTAATWSAIAFVASAGAAAIAWTYLTGSSDFGRGSSATKLGWQAPPGPAPSAPPAVGMKHRVIDGAALAADAPDAARYFAAAIDNLSVARPQAGLARASLVFEAPVEGGITRLLAIYPDV
ncbi:MAG: hypothetical protein RL272_851, partial [Candidatus Parcubacteria bacterium]